MSRVSLYGFRLPTPLLQYIVISQKTAKNNLFKFNIKTKTTLKNTHSQKHWPLAAVIYIYIYLYVCIYMYIYYIYLHIYIQYILYIYNIYNIYTIYIIYIVSIIHIYIIYYIIYIIYIYCCLYIYYHRHLDGHSYPPVVSLSSFLGFVIKIYKQE